MALQPRACVVGGRVVWLCFSIWVVIVCRCCSCRCRHCAVVLQIRDQHGARVDVVQRGEITARGTTLRVPLRAGHRWSSNGGRFHVRACMHAWFNGRGWVGSIHLSVLHTFTLLCPQACVQSSEFNCIHVLAFVTHARMLSLRLFRLHFFSLSVLFL